MIIFMTKCLKNNQSIDYDFINWINKIESNFLKKFNVELLDLPGEPYMECFENNFKPDDMIKQILESNSILFANSTS
jgi:hypothetical protein